jgi:hypothetical protein
VLLEKLLFTGPSIFFSRTLCVIVLFIRKLNQELLSWTEISVVSEVCTCWLIATHSPILGFLFCRDVKRVYFPNQRHLIIIYAVDTIYSTFHAELISQNRPPVSAPNIVLACYMWGTKPNFSFQWRIFCTWIRPLFVPRYDVRFLVFTLFNLHELPHSHACLKQTVLRSVVCAGLN